MYSRKLLGFAVTACLLIAGCASTGGWTSQAKDQPVNDKMSKLADDIKHELIIQNRMNFSGGEYAAGKKITIDFEGTVADFAKSLSGLGFNVRVVGKKPPFDLYLNLHHDQSQIFYILEDAATQLPKFVHIDLYADEEIVISYEG